MKTVLALDQGTTSSRALLFDHSGKVLSKSQREFAQHFPQPGWVEHDAREIWLTQKRVAIDAIAQCAQRSQTAPDIVAIGITNQRETTVLWDRATGEPVAPAIVWQDRRTATFCEALKTQGHETAVREKTGLVIDAYFSGTKLKWLLDHVPHARERAARGELAFGTVDSWLIWNLTSGKVHATDVSNASRTLLFDIHRLDWDDDLLALMDIPRSVLPQIVSSSEVIGTTDCDGLPAGIPIGGVAGDQQAALFGQACHQPGMAKNTYGTGCFMLMNTGDKAVVSRHRLISTVAWRLGKKFGAQTQYALEGSVFIGGAAVQWLRDGLGIIGSSAEIEALAASVPDTGGVYIVPAFAGLGAPHWDPNARGAMFGLTRGSTRAHIARATLESIAYQSTELAVAMREDAAIPLAELRVDGGATVNNLLMQCQADLSGVKVVRPKITETTALGAAYLAGLATEFWDSPAEIATLWVQERTFLPTLPREDAQAKMQKWRNVVERTKGWPGMD
ncbi:MAG: glycerol kinase GlpK [Betaproteobacteria bacterium]|nr:glycerol kinase GlpK [Betaproteobacteria bacterium]